MKYQIGIFNEGISNIGSNSVAKRIIESKLVKHCTLFRYVIVDSDHFSSKFLVNFLSLQKIANLLIDVYA